jgi:hypothetical protein
VLVRTLRKVNMEEEKRRRAREREGQKNKRGGVGDGNKEWEMNTVVAGRDGVGRSRKEEM